MNIDQAAAVPFRQRGEVTEFCLVTAIRSGRWGVPKGIIDPGETAAETAVKEALEEAGVQGRIIGEPVGTYQYSKWGAVLVVQVFLLEVEREDAEWAEKSLRDRRWVPADQAVSMLAEHPGLAVIHEAMMGLRPGGGPG
jgi:phosphohistidine phosphatase